MYTRIGFESLDKMIGHMNKNEIPVQNVISCGKESSLGMWILIYFHQNEKGRTGSLADSDLAVNIYPIGSISEDIQYHTQIMKAYGFNCYPEQLNLFTVQQVEHAFNESRLTHPMAGFKYDTFRDYYAKQLLKIDET